MKLAVPDQHSCLAGERIPDSGSQGDFRAPSTPLFIPPIYNLQSGMKPLSHLVRRTQFSVYLEVLWKSDQFERKKKKQKKQKKNIDLWEKLTFGIIKSRVWDLKLLKRFTHASDSDSCL